MTYDETEIRAHTGEIVTTIRECRHDERVIPVETLIDGEITTVAALCLDCDEQIEVVVPAWEEA